MPRKTTKKTTKTKRKPTSAAKAKGLKASPELPPAPLERLSETETKRRLKIIIGGLTGEVPSTIDDDSGVRRVDLLLKRLAIKINQHFFPAPLNGFSPVFPKGETVIQCAQRIKLTRDPQIPS